MMRLPFSMTLLYIENSSLYVANGFISSLSSEDVHGHLSRVNLINSCSTLSLSIIYRCNRYVYVKKIVGC